MKVVIVGGGIGGLALALALHARGIDCEVFEAVAEVREVGVGITLLPHAMRELAALGLADRIEPLGIENLESVFCNRWGQFIFKEARGRHAGYDLPEISLHRGRLHRTLLDAVLERLGQHRVHLNHRFVRVDQGEAGATVHFVGGTDASQYENATRLAMDAGLADATRLVAVKADVVVGCDGVNSSVRRQFYPDESLAFAGINTWRGVTRHRPILTGKTYLRIGSIDTGKMVIYPIVNDIDGQGLQLINWVAEIRRPDSTMNDWNRSGRIEDFIDIFADWRFDWLDVPALLRNAERVFEYPMVDRDPVAQWSFGRVTLLGDAAHPMYPRGSNGSAQALIDARVLAQTLAEFDPPAALKSYEAQRLAATARIVETNRTVPPDYIIMKVDELSGGQPFAQLDDLISPQALQAISDEYKRIAGFSLPR
jgi:5-methylphenazine-1-carboxylate 1-monooxygenase